MVALIPARGGSKGIPGKNIHDLAGRPLISYAIEAAKSARHIHRVVVSTDCPNIAQVSTHWGAEVPFLRPTELARDESLAVDAYLHAIDFLRGEGEELNSFCILQPTSPLRTSQDIDHAIELFHAKSADSVISVCEAPHPASWFRHMDEQAKLTPHDHGGGKGLNRQAEPKLYIPNGAVYVLRTEFFKAAKSYYTGATYGFEMPRERSVDIDLPLDLAVAEMLISKGMERRYGTTGS